MLSAESLHILPDFRLWLRFSDGVDGIADLSAKLTGPVFDSLHDTERFGTAILDRELQTVAWPNGADLAPKFLHALVLGSTQSSR